jgi:hypothetical protein
MLISATTIPAGKMSEQGYIITTFLGTAKLRLHVLDQDSTTDTVWLLRLKISSGTREYEDEWFVHWQPGQDPKFGPDPRLELV